MLTLKLAKKNERNVVKCLPIMEVRWPHKNNPSGASTKSLWNQFMNTGNCRRDTSDYSILKYTDGSIGVAGKACSTAIVTFGCKNLNS